MLRRSCKGCPGFRASRSATEILKQYIPVIDALIGTFGQSHPGHVYLGDVKGWEYFEANHETICFKETRDSLPYFIHPNEIGAPILGQYWGEAIYTALFLQPSD